MFLNVVELLLDDGLMTLNGMFGRFGSVCIGIMFVDGLYLIVFIAFSWYYRVQMGKIKSIV